MAKVMYACSMCRGDIEEGANYFRCSVSSCNSGRMKMRFCTKQCWEKHIPTARHRNASFVEETATADE